MDFSPEFEAEVDGFEAYFLDPTVADESLIAWSVRERLPVIDALRGVLSGSSAAAHLRVYCLMELLAVPQARLSRELIAQTLHALRPGVAEPVLKRLRELGLLSWDATALDYQLTPLARALQPVLVALTQDQDPNDELGALLAQVAGAETLGLTQPGQLRQLQAQLARLHDDFAEAIASGSEGWLRQAQPRFERAMQLVDRAGQALTALIRSGADDARIEREARALGMAQAKLLTMASQFTRALQQADRQRVTLGSTGVTSSDVRAWLQAHPNLADLLQGALQTGVQPVFVSAHELIDVTEGEFERDRPDPERSQGLPPPIEASAGVIDAPSLPAELGALINMLAEWAEQQRQPRNQQQSEQQPRSPSEKQPADAELSQYVSAEQPLSRVVLGGRYAQAAYRLQLMPLLGDPQAQTLKGQTGALARSPWRAQFAATVQSTEEPEVLAISSGAVRFVESNSSNDRASSPQNSANSSSEQTHESS